MQRLSKAVAYALTGATTMMTLLLLTPGTAQAQGQGKLAAAAPVTYDNRYEVYGGINFRNFQAGQNVTERMNMGGGEVLGTYWLTDKIGLGADFRGDAGTTPTMPVPAELYKGHPVVYLLTGMVGAQYRGPKNQHAALNYHAYGGVTHGTFDATADTQVAALMGLYSNRTKPTFALGASLDFNRSKRLAIRIQPDLLIEHFGTDTREFFAISGGLVYRIGKR
ncbi:hypothetical protein SAMN05421770_10498 [Granulicella rosea]|uniref:Outer membrane protein beta-barrel domain-containing protein n=1 Tax=Granulicella rosea TaxID=474952 RepID=A0A239JS29_9BACT|nr:hypothetical protein [Granulicella rosea]SNT08635.1 hypothetical protein SAMN05421770_10498 [Granulicella rosea]